MHQFKLGAETQRKYTERQVGQLQAELDSERTNSEHIKQQLVETEEHLKEAVKNADDHRNRAVLFQQSAQKIARDAEQMVLGLRDNHGNGAAEQGQYHVEGYIARVLLESAHNKAMLQMRERLDQAEGKEGVEMVNKMGRTNLDLQYKIQSLRGKRDEANTRSSKLLEENATLSARIAVLEGELAEHTRDLSGCGDGRPQRKKRKTRAD